MAGYYQDKKTKIYYTDFYIGSERIRLSLKTKKKAEAQKRSDGKRVWLREDSAMRKPRAIYRAFDELGFNNPDSIAKCGRRSPKNLRDTFATIQVGMNTPLEHVQKMLGHTSSKMTQKYAAYNMADVWSAANDVTDVLETILENKKSA
ncbi:hypothetical protein C1J03_13435 [Sulfitobacter sp. SK012]|uniref:tyrosine-type recombinase/integrase n=1 Tax=Sulfitobacter sp. SK012 TaxID=1389005 RepID=UPI000E0BBDA6|nr:tyrosine-type recombinase/integrase [Sulfitobacter sp. SK012]AXI46933.1 hypothetical protein C1J03_13435 [Sulfitobacter sp. SK012]